MGVQGSWVNVQRGHSAKSKPTIKDKAVNIFNRYSPLNATAVEQQNSGHLRFSFMKHEVSNTSYHSQLHVRGQSRQHRIEKRKLLVKAKLIRS